MSESNNNYYQLPGSVIQHQSSVMQPILSESSSSLTTENSMEYPVLLLTQQPDSHHFNERRIVLNDTIKVGRSVARARPSDINAIFDCKVLSRNHAIFWYDSGKVWLRDTKSSNGTFVNSQLLSKGTEDSSPREIYSGDIIQFGVEVVENTTTHGCIIAQVSILMSDGSEIRRHPDMSGLPSGSIPISNYYEEQIYQLAQYIQEAAHREQTLEKKLNNLSQLIIDTQEASDSSWKVILNQDRLMEKLEMLQEQVEIQSKGDEQDSLAVELRRVLEQRYGLERESKKLLERLIQEKAEVLQRVVDLEHSLEASEDECTQLRTAFEALQLEHGKISNKVVAGKDEVEALQKRLKEAQNEYSTEMNILTADKDAINARYSQLCEEANNMRLKLENMDMEINKGHSSDLFGNQLGSEKLKEDLDRTESEIYKCRDMLQQSSDRQIDLSSSVTGLQTQLSRALISEIIDLQRLQRLEVSMTNSEANLDALVMGTTSELALHFMQSMRQIREGEEMIRSLKSEVKLLHQMTSSYTYDTTGKLVFCARIANDMESLLNKMSDCQSKTKTLSSEIPDKLLLTVMEYGNVSECDDKVCQTSIVEPDLSVSEPVGVIVATSFSKSDILVQTDPVNMVNSEMQSSTEDISKSLCVQTIIPYPTVDSDSIEVLQNELQQCFNRLDSEKKITDSLKIEIIQLQSEKRELQSKFDIVANDFEQLKKHTEDSKTELDLRRDTLQRVGASEYGQLYQECQKLRIQIQEIEEEMLVKRKEYDSLYEQNEALLKEDKATRLRSAAMSDKVDQLEQLCSKQRCEIDEMRDSMNKQYQTILVRSRRISAISSVPLFVVVLVIIVFILSFLARP